MRLSNELGDQMTDVFVSYASQDRDRVVAIVDAIERRGWSVWWDREIGVGSAFDREIEKAIDGARCIVVVWSAVSIESDWVRNEATEGLERGILVPVLIDSIRPPLAFRRTQTIDLFAGSSFESLLDAIQQFAPLAAKQGREKSVFVGRDAELSKAVDLLHRARQGSGGLLLVCGEAGVGKSRLAQEVAITARDAGMLCLTGRCLEMGGAPPYHPLIQQIEQAVRLVDPETMRISLGDNAPEMVKLMPELGQHFADIPAPVSLPPDQERRYLLHGCGEFIARAAQTQPMLLTFEDLHWADESTCVLLRHLAERLQDAPVLMIGSYRDDELDSSCAFSRVLPELVRERLVEEIRLKRLDANEVSALLERRTGQTPPRALISIIYSETEGNPFFVEELYRHLEESGKLFDEQGIFQRVVSITDAEVPRSVRLILEQRLEQVSEACRSLLTVAAVIGRLVSFEQLTHLSELEGEPLFDALEEAEDAALMEDVSVGREVRYQFVHEQVRQTLLGMLSIPRRQRLHLRVADALEKMLGEKTDLHAGEIAYHLYQAGAAADGPRTFRFLLLAGQRALDGLAFEDALRELDMALEVMASDDQDALGRIHAMRAFALRGAANVDDALESLNQGIALGEEVANFVELLLQCAGLLVDLYRGGEALPLLDQLLETARSREDLHLELQTQVLMSKAHYSLSLDDPSHAKLAKESSDRTIELARRAEDNKALANALIASSHFVDYWDDFRPQAARNLSEAKTIGETLNDEDIGLDCASMGLRVDMFIPIEYELRAEEILLRLEERRDPIRLKEHLFWMIVPARNAGHLERSVEVCDQAIELAARLDVPPVQYPTFKSFALISLGRFGEAWQSIEQEVTDGDYRFGAALQRFGFLEFKRVMGFADAVIDEAGPLLEETHALNRLWMVDAVSQILVVTSARCGQHERALELVREKSDVGARLNRFAEAEVALAGGNPAEAMEMAQEVRALHERRGRLLLSADMSELVMCCLAVMDRWDELIDQVDRVIEFCENSGYRALSWKLFALRGRARRAVGRLDEAEQDQTSAAVILRELAETIEQPELRRAFETQPVAIDLLRE